MKKEWITRTDAARLAKVSAATITNWSKSGLITVKVINRMMYVNKKTLTDLLESSLYKKTADLEELERQLDEKIEKMNKEIKEVEDVTRFIRIGHKKYSQCKELIITSLIDNIHYYNDNSDFHHIHEILVKYLNFLNSVSIGKVEKNVDEIKELADYYGLTKSDFTRYVNNNIKILYDNNKLVLEKLEKLTEENIAKDIELAKLRKSKDIEDKNKDINITINDEQKKRIRLLETNIRDPGLSRRAFNTLNNRNIGFGDMKNIGDIVRNTELELRCIRNLGYITYNELDFDVVKKFGLCWGMDVDLYLLTGEVKRKKG